MKTRVTNLEALRRHHRLGQGHLAAKAGISQGLVSQIEAGVTTPSKEVLRRLADALWFSPPERLLRHVWIGEDEAEGRGQEAMGAGR